MSQPCASPSSTVTVPRSPPPPGSSTGLRTSPSIQAFESWSEDMIRTLTTLISCLSGMMRARHSFETHNIRYFGPDRPGAKRCDHAESNLKLRTDFLDHIQRIFSVFEIYLARLNDLKKQMIIDNRHAVSDVYSSVSLKCADPDDAGGHSPQVRESPGNCPS